MQPDVRVWADSGRLDRRSEQVDEAPGSDRPVLTLGQGPVDGLSAHVSDPTLPHLERLAIGDLVVRPVGVGPRTPDRSPTTPIARVHGLTLSHDRRTVSAPSP